MKIFQIKTFGNEKIAEVIQERLFELGYKWEYDQDQAVRHVGAGSYQVGYREVGTITWTHTHSLAGGGESITLEELFNMQPEAKETIKIGNQTYDKADFEAATKHLTPIK